MKRYAVSLLVAATVFAHADRPERNAFLNYSVHSVGELTSEVKKDPAVADRFERHFAMTEDQVISFFQTLHYTRLERSAVYDVYSIPPDGHVKMHHERLIAGVPIFEDSSGTPILLVKCGNPIIGVKEGEVLIGGPYTPMVPAVPGTPGEGVPPSPDLAMTPPPTPGDLYVPPSVDVTPPPTGTIVTTSGGSANYAWLGIIAAGGAIYGLTTIHGGHPPHHPVPPVPEPSTYALLGLGVGGILLKRRKKA